MLSRLIRQFVLMSSRGPVLRLYVWVYRVMAVTTARYVAGAPGVRSVYLRRGLAKGESVPGISDIDLAIITEPSVVGAQAEVWRRYRQAKRCCMLLDESPDVMDRATFQARRRSTRYQYRLAEGKATWEVLAGADDLAELPDSDVDQMESSVYFELRYWWALFSWQVLRSRSVRQDPVIRNALCYKIVAEFLKIRLALEQRLVVFGRTEALERCEPFLAEDELPLVERLRRIAKGRFRANDPELLDLTFAFLLRFLDRLHPALEQNPHFAEPEGSDIRLDSPRCEWYWPEHRERYIRELIADAETRFRGVIRSVYVAKGVDFPLSDFALLLEVDPLEPPTLEQVAQLRRQHLRHEGPDARRFHIYLLLEHCAVQIDVDDRRGNWDSTLRGFVSPLTNPDIFAAIGSSDAVLQGDVRAPCRLGGWTPALQELTRDRLAAVGPALCDDEFTREWGCYQHLATGLRLWILGVSGPDSGLYAAQTTQALLRFAAARAIEPPAAVAPLLDPRNPGFESANHDPAVARKAWKWLSGLAAHPER